MMLALHSLLFLLSGCDKSSDPKNPDSTGQIDSVPTTQTMVATKAIILIVDGLRLEDGLGDGFSNVAGTDSVNLLPAIRENLLPIGALVRPTYNVGFTKTAPGHCNLITGHREYYWNFATAGGSRFYRSYYPTIFEEIRQQLALEVDDLLFMGNSNLISDSSYSVYPGLGPDAGLEYQLVTGTNGDATEDDMDVFEDARAAIEANTPIFSFINVKEVDRNGHNGVGAEYVGSIDYLDQPIVDFWNWLQTLPDYKDQTLLIISSDHGRHRTGAVDDWVSHGDSCTGCREVATLALGPGVRQGEVIETPYTLEDIATTASWVVGVQMPYAQGVLMSDIFEDPPDFQEVAGDIMVAASQTLEAHVELSGDSSQRSQVVSGGEVLSNESATWAEEPSVFQNETDEFICWRELTMSADVSPWNAQCRHRATGTSAWEIIDAPAEAVWSVWTADLVEDSSGRVWSAWFSQEGDELGTIDFGRWNGETWERASARDQINYPESAYYVSYPVIAPQLDGTLVALVASESVQMARYTRHVRVYRLDWPETGVLEWSDALFHSTEFDTAGNTYGRMEFPAFYQQDTVIDLAMIGFAEEGNRVLVTRSEDEGQSWSDLVPVSDDVLVFGHVRPIWKDGGLFFAGLSSDDQAVVCRYDIELSSTSCQETGSTRVDSISVTPDSVMVSIDSGTGQWEITTLMFPSESR